MFPPVSLLKRKVTFSDEKAADVDAPPPKKAKSEPEAEAPVPAAVEEDAVAKRKSHEEEPRKNRKVKTQFVRSKERAMSSYFQRVHIRDSIFMPSDEIGKQMGLSTKDVDILYDFGNCPVWDTHSDYRSCGHVKRTALDDKENLAGDVVIYSPSQVPYEQRERQAVLVGEIINGSIKQFSVSFFRIEDNDTKKNHIYPVEISVCREGKLDVGNYGKVEFSEVAPASSNQKPIPVSDRIEREEKDILKRYCAETGTPENHCTVKRIRMSSEFSKVEEKIKKEENSAAKKEEDAAADVVMDSEDDFMHFNEAGEYVSTLSAEDDLRTAFLFGDKQYAKFFSLKKQVKAELFSELEQVVDGRISQFVDLDSAKRADDTNAELAPLVAKFAADLKALKVPVNDKEPAAIFELAHRIIKNSKVKEQAASAEKFSKNVVNLFNGSKKAAPAAASAEPPVQEEARSKNSRAREEEEEEPAKNAAQLNYESPMQRLMRLTRENKRYISQNQLNQNASELPPPKFTSPEEKQRYNNMNAVKNLFVSTAVSQKYAATKEDIKALPPLRV